jgi:hypothetical protein
VPDHYLAWLVGVVAGCAATIAVAVATRVRLLPEVVDISLVPTFAGVGGLIFAAYGAMCAPAWVVYLGDFVALLVVIAPLAIWEDRHH